MKISPPVAGIVAVAVTAGLAGLLWLGFRSDATEGTAPGDPAVTASQNAASQAPTTASETVRATPEPGDDAPVPPAGGESADKEEMPDEIAALAPSPVTDGLVSEGPAQPSFLERDQRVTLTLNEPRQDGPRIDLVRVDPGGAAILAGRGKPGTEIDILIGDEIVMTVPVERSGSFAAVLDTPISAGSQVIRLQSRIGDEVIAGAEIVTVLVPGGDRSKRPVVVVSEPDRPTRVVQQTSSSQPARTGFGLDVVDYNENGRVVFSGSAKAAAWVRIRLGRDVLGRVQADDQGRWTMTSPSDIPAGRYVVHVEELDAQDQVTRRAEFLFERARFEDLVIADGEMIVQPGNNLWNIAKSNYGSGFKYTVIYSANAGKISDPDLIFPGQVLSLPSN